MTYNELREKDVIDVCSGKRLGTVDDLSFDTDCGRITGITVCPHLFALSKKSSVRVPWRDIVCVGEDAILVKTPREDGKKDGSPIHKC